MRVGTLAITDHDTTDAIPAARAEIARSGLALNLVSGVEISTVWENHEIHIGLNIDIEHPALVTFLQEQKTRRNQRRDDRRASGKGAYSGRAGRAQKRRTAGRSRAVISPVFWVRQSHDHGGCL
jgi:predicted metal-dependent phosphoesterase TrpH